jgi:hypothetical protein
MKRVKVQTEIMVLHIGEKNAIFLPVGVLPFNAGIKSLYATPPDEIFYWGFCFLNRVFRLYICENQQIHQLFIQFINYVW